MQTIISLFFLASLCFFLLKVFPGSPFDEEIHLNPKVEQNLKSYYGLDQPVLSQYLHFVQNLLQGKLGYSMHFEGKSVTAVIAQSLPTTLQLGGAALLFSIVCGFLVGFLAARSKFFSEIHGAYVLTSISLPTLMLGPLLIWYFCFQLDWLPVAQLNSASAFILPVILLSLRPIAVLSRLLKNSLDEALRSDYARTAKAMGLGPSRILIKWALRNSLIPFMSYVAILIAGLLSGSLLIEMLFAIPGLGTQFLDALINRDYSLVVGLALFYGVLLMISQLIVDILIQLFDPRIKSL